MSGRSTIGVSGMMSYINSRYRMRKENLIQTHPLLDPFTYQLPLTSKTLTADTPYQPRQDVVNWLNESLTGKFQYIFDLGDLWGISFEKEEDALLFKMTWL